MLLDTLVTILLGNMLAGHGVMRADYGTIRAGEGKLEVVKVLAGQNFSRLII